MVAVEMHAPLDPELLAAWVDRQRLRQSPALRYRARLSIGIARGAAQEKSEAEGRDEEAEGTLRMTEGSHGQRSNTGKGAFSYHRFGVGAAFVGA